MNRIVNIIDDYIYEKFKINLQMNDQRRYSGWQDIKLINY